jgi:hypothetical protein
MCFFGGGVKGPAADATDAPQPLRLIVQLCDEDYQFFSFFRVMEHWWNESDRGKTEVLGEKPVPVPLCPHGLIRDRTRAADVRGRRLTA